MAAGWALLAGGAVHVGAFVGGPRWMTALGAPPSIVASAARGTWPAPAGTAAIVAFLIVLALYCFSAAGRIRRLPFTRAILSVFAGIFVVRGLLAIPLAVAGPRGWATPVGRFAATGTTFIPGSVVVLAIGILIVLGLAGPSGTPTPKSERAPG